jgi:hypothetical protein
VDECKPLPHLHHHAPLLMPVPVQVRRRFMSAQVVQAGVREAECDVRAVLRDQRSAVPEGYTRT